METFEAPNLDQAGRILLWLRRAAPAGVAVAGGPIGERAAGAFPGEAEGIARAAAKRRFEFHAGRAYAREALAQLGAPPEEIPRGPQGRPLWPAGFHGSISHTDCLAFAVAARSETYEGVGVDVEDSPILDASLGRFICHPHELAQVPTAGSEATMRLMVAKEAAIKAHAQARGVLLDLLQMRIAFDSNSDAYRAYGEGGADVSGMGEELFRGRLASIAGAVAAVGYAPRRRRPA